MKLTYFKSENNSPLIEEYYELVCDKNCIPFKSKILPNGNTHFTYIFSPGQKAVFKNKKTPLYQLNVTGIFYQSYEFQSNHEGSSFGITLHPTALYKLLQIDVSKIENTHIPVNKVHLEFSKKLNTVFQDYKTPEKAVKDIELLINNTPLTINQHTIIIDKAINLIRKKEGVILIEELLQLSNISQKTLETQFKKIVGITPGKYIRLYRFINFMKKYENQEINLKDLIYMYNYYDSSHFNKDFKLFMNESPTSFFKKDNEFIKKTLE